MDHTAPMNIFLKQEIDSIQVVIKLIRFMLKDLLLAIQGVIIMSEVIFLGALPYHYNHYIKRSKVNKYEYIFRNCETSSTIYTTLRYRRCGRHDRGSLLLWDSGLRNCWRGTNSSRLGCGAGDQQSSG